MNDVVELPAEANPLTENILYHVLKSAASSDPQQIQTGTKQLQQWEKEQGYYCLLQSAFIDKRLPVEIRYLAVIQLKNGIDKYWRKAATNAVSKEDKSVIRSRLLESGAYEQDHRLALQNALVMAKVVRFEYPHDWPDAITTIIDRLRTSTSSDANPLLLPRLLLVLLHIIKELATGRLQRTRLSLHAVTPEIFAVLGRIYLAEVQSWMSWLQGNVNDEATAHRSVENSLLSIRILRRLLIAGYEFPNRENDIQQFWRIVSTQVEVFLGIISQQSSILQDQRYQLVKKHLLQLAKLHLTMSTTHPAAFVLLPDSLDLVRSYWKLVKSFGETFGSKETVTSAVASATIGADGNADDDKPFLEKMSLKGLLIIRACLAMVFNPNKTFKYKYAEEKEEKAQAVQSIRERLLTEPFVREVMETIVIKFFVFRRSDLEEWEEEPEEWERREDGEGEGYEFSIRPCSEKVFLDLAINFRDIVVQPLLNVFYSVASPDNHDVLFKDSVYSAIGLAAQNIHQELDFDAFLSSTLVTEVQETRPGYNILRRRIAILLAQWISVEISEANRPLVYQIFQHLLDKADPLNDKVVRVTAGRQFKDIADEWDFKAESFLPYASDILTRLMALIEEVELTETKMALLNTISIVVERLESHITPYADRIISLLPPLWEQSGEEHLMKQAILTVLSRLVHAMKAASLPYHSMDTQLYLLEDALDLWSAILTQTPAPAPSDLLALAPYLFSIFELGSENLRKALEITDSYILLAPADMLSEDMRQRLFASFSTLLNSGLKSEATGLLTHLVETIIRAADSLGGEPAVSRTTADLLAAGFLRQIINGLKGSWQAHCTTGPRAAKAPIDGMIETDYFAVLARILLASTDTFLAAIESVEPLESGMYSLLEEWFSHFENIGDPSRKKLMALALTSLLSTGPSWRPNSTTVTTTAGPAQRNGILNHLQSLMTMWTDLITELADSSEGDPNNNTTDNTTDSLVYPPPSPPPAAATPEAPEDERRRRLTYSDPVHTINTAAFVKHHLQQAVATCPGGVEVFEREWVGRVDADVIRGFGGLGIM
ncbi:hypothetical protein LTR04_000446 [Oleoguttula sp. CCFEE 6159]|nr:hypothetical protein LTR04_000446 [Oleoguttula sp. CCFEE 6159]